MKPAAPRIHYARIAAGVTFFTLLAAAFDCGILEVRAASLLAVMGLFDLIGTTASGWLSGRCNCRYLLFGYYSLRGISL